MERAACLEGSLEIWMFGSVELMELIDVRDMETTMKNYGTPDSEVTAFESLVQLSNSCFG